MLYDIRVVRFVKTTDDLPVNKNTKADFICLGHFDMMHIARLGEFTEKPLQEIQEDRDDIGESEFGCTENYVYSLYLLKGIEKEDIERLEMFWTTKSTYTVVTRIHCDYPSDWSGAKSPFSRIIEAYCANQTQESSRVVYREPDVTENKCIISFDSAINLEGKAKAKVDCLFYDSLELGDTVSIMKSNSIAAVLEVIRCLSGCNCVRDTYTYCGIDREILQNDERASIDCVEEGAELAYISTRFSVRDIRNANTFFCKLEHNTGIFAPHFYVTGTADRSVRWSGNKEEQLIDIMRALVKQGQDMHVCFNDVITRIGIQQKIEGDPNGTITKRNNQDITSVVPYYRETMDWLRLEHKTMKAVNWKYTLLKLLGTLEAMYTNYVMDDLADLLIPSVKAFLIRLNYLRAIYNGNISDEYDEDIIKFLNCWTSLMNDISQLESQLTQHPELTPVRYYIPAMVLQFELRFVEHCCKALSTGTSRSFVPMLLPVDTPDLSTECPLDPRQENYNDACPLLVSIPFRDLYRPWETAFRMAHEMAHYCEDPSRNRLSRHNALIQCTAEYITKYWYDTYVVPSSEEQAKHLRSASRKYTKELVKRISENIKLNYPDKQWYLSETIDVLDREMMGIILSTEHLEKYLFNIQAEYFFKKQKDYTALKRNQEIPAECLTLQHYFGLHLGLLRFLCGECYADIAMVLITNCNFNDYYLSVYMDEYNRFAEQESETAWLIQNPQVMCQIVRMALVLYAVNQVPNFNKTWDVNTQIRELEETNPLVACSFTIVKEFVSKGTSVILSGEHTNAAEYASVKDFKYIGKYLSDSAKKLAEELNDTNSDRSKYAQYVRNGIACVQNGAFDWNKVQQYILN